MGRAAVGRVVGVTSAKGGVGKTTVTPELARALGRYGSVCEIVGSSRNPNLDDRRDGLPRNIASVVDDKEPATWWTAPYTGVCLLAGARTPEQRQSESFVPCLLRAIRRAANTFDHVVVDLDQLSADPVTAKVLGELDVVVAVVSQERESRTELLNYIDYYRTDDKYPVGADRWQVVFFDRLGDQRLQEDLARIELDEYGWLGSISFDRRLAELINTGRYQPAAVPPHIRSEFGEIAAALAATTNTMARRDRPVSRTRIPVPDLALSAVEPPEHPDRFQGHRYAVNVGGPLRLHVMTHHPYVCAPSAMKDAHVQVLAAIHRHPSAVNAHDLVEFFSTRRRRFQPRRIQNIFSELRDAGLVHTTKRGRARYVRLHSDLWVDTDALYLAAYNAANRDTVNADTLNGLVDVLTVVEGPPYGQGRSAGWEFVHDTNRHGINFLDRPTEALVHAADVLQEHWNTDWFNSDDAHHAVGVILDARQRAALADHQDRCLILAAATIAQHAHPRTRQHVHRVAAVHEWEPHQHTHLQDHLHPPSGVSEHEPTDPATVHS